MNNPLLSNLEYALSYYKKGFSVFPILKGSKNKPLIMWKEYMSHRADEKKIRDWWAKFPMANIAIVTGAISGMFVLDTEKDFDLSNIQIPDNTPTVKTGSGGRHFYFKIPQGTHIGTHIEIWGKDPKNKADIKSDGGYVVAPPSYNEEKESHYEWLTEIGEELPEPPEWLVREIETRESTKQPVSIASLTAGASEGSRNVSAAAFVGHVLLRTEMDMWEIVCWPAVQKWNEKNVPPLSEQELRGIFDSIVKREYNRRNNLETKDDLKDYEGEDKVITSHEMRDKVALLQENEIKYFLGFGPVDRACDGFVPGELLVVSGPEKSGKTTLLQSFTYQFAKQNYGCLWFTYEMTPRELIKRFIDLPIFYLPAMNKAYDLKWLERRIYEAKAKYDIKFVFIDHLEFIVDVETTKNSATSLGYVVRYIKNIARENDLVVFLVQHIKRIQKEETPGVRDIRDSALIAAEADSTIMIWRTADNAHKRLKKGETPTYTNASTIKVCNHRRTGVVERAFQVKYVNHQYVEVTNQYDAPSEEQGVSLESVFS